MSEVNSQPTAHATEQEMPAETLRALLDSIVKWEKRAAGDDTSARPENCPLCLLFNRPNQQYGESCKGCPVRDAGHRWCEDTPYEDWQRARALGATREIRDAAAQREVDFLKSLLPPEALAALDVPK